MKKLLCWLTLLCLLLTPVLSALAEGSDGHAIEAVAMDFYYFDPDSVLQFPVYFVDGEDVPYFSLADWPAFFAGPTEDGTFAEEITDPVFSMEGSVGRLTRPDGYFVEFDCDTDTVHFYDYDAYMRPNTSAFLIDMLDNVENPGEDEAFTYFARLTSSYERYGKEVTINAGDYGIDFIAGDGTCYVPMQTLSDVLLSYYFLGIFYNGEAAFLAGKSSFGKATALTPLGELYYSVTPHARSEAMAKFTYNELCLVLDALYGLKGNHNIASFNDLADETGLIVELTSTDPVEADAALYKLLTLHLDDLHTCYMMPSPLSGVQAADGFLDELGDGQSDMNFDGQITLYGEARKLYYPDGVPAYEEVGNTAYITFDGFDPIPGDVDYYQVPPASDVEDTMGILIYAYQQITREDSPIENVVLDLSCNLGGSAKTAVYTIASFLGRCSVSVRNTLSGALVTGNYRIDLNLDGNVDDDDLALMNKNLYCLESPVSFSCGNLVPCVFKHSNRVTLLGRTSGGGACIVQPLCTADGAIFQISGPLQLSFLKNGAFYDIDQGADPDFPLMKPESFYDRVALTDYINQIR